MSISASNAGRTYLMGCDVAFIATAFGAKNIRTEINESASNSESTPSFDGDKSTGRLAQLAVYRRSRSRASGLAPRRFTYTVCPRIFTERTSGALQFLAS